MREKDQVSCCFFFLPGQQLDGNAWTLPVGIRKSDENRAAVHATQKGGSPRDDGDRPAGVGSRKERKNLGKVSNLPESHSDFSDSLKRRKDNTAPPPQKKKTKSKDIMSRLQIVLRTGKLDFFHSFSWLAIPLAQCFSQSMSWHSNVWVGQDVRLVFCLFVFCIVAPIVLSCL